MPYQLKQVVNAQDENDFADVGRVLYANDPNWVAPLDMELKAPFNPKKNELLAKGEAARWVLRDSSGQLAGRIAAFINRNKADKFEQPTGGIGFFECVNDTEAAHLLFDTAKAWLAQRGMEAMDGPINFGENDRFSGLLVKGFMQQGYGMLYNPPYYETLFTEYGFGVYYDQVSKHLNVLDVPNPRFAKIAEWVQRKPGVRFGHADKKHLEVYARQFREIYNDTWRHHEHFSEMSEAQVQKLAKELKPILVDFYMIFAYVDDEPAGLLLCLPDLNQIFKPLKGKFPLWQQILFLIRSRNNFAWYLKRGILTRGRVIIIGVRPKFQKYGLEAGMTIYSWLTGREAGFREIELGWVGDFNPMSRSLQDASGAAEGKTHRTYRYLFDPTKRAQRAKALVESEKLLAKTTAGEAK